MNKGLPVFLALLVSLLPYHAHAQRLLRHHVLASQASRQLLIPLLSQLLRERCILGIEICIQLELELVPEMIEILVAQDIISCSEGICPALIKASAVVFAKVWNLFVSVEELWLEGIVV